ncbi:MAG: MFS transporter [Gammaproteobacteria bacterium]|nr:MFS transporter [Gammaproteobacteria bacterium]
MTSNTFRQTILLPWIICSLGALFYCYEYFLRISPSVMTRELMAAYDLTGAQVGNLSAFYYHAYVPMQILVGLFMDRYGPRRLLTLACLFCAFGAYLFAGNYGLGIAETGRFLVGFGSAFAFVGALKLATIWLPPNRFALVSGIILCLGMIGAMIGDVLLRVMVDAIGWQLTIYAASGAGIFLSLVIYLVVRDASPISDNHHIHVISFKNVFVGLFQALKNPQIWLNAFVGFLLYISLSAFAELWGIPYLEQAHNLTKTHAAYANSMIFLGWAVGGPFWGWFSDFIGRRCLPMTIASIGGLIMACCLLYVPHLSLTSIYFILFIFGFLSSVQILIFAIAHEASQMKIAGTVIALTNMVVMVGGSIFQPVIGKLLDMEWTGVMLDGGRVYPTHAYQLALSVIPVSILIAIIVTFFIRETHCALQHRVKS